MKKILLASAAMVLATGANATDDVNVGIILGFTGPIETLTPAMRDSALLAVDEVNAAGGVNGAMLAAKTADSTCIDAAAATTAAEGLVNSDNVVAIMGADCSGVTTAVVNNVSAVSGVTTISPSATSPALSTIEDKDYFFRTAPSDARQGEILAEVLMANGAKRVAITYSNSDYGSGLSNAVATAFEALGGTITINAPHDDGKGDYSAEVAALAAAGGDVLVVLGYADQGGAGVIQASLDTGAFETFAMGDGMHAASLMEKFGTDMPGSYGVLPASEGPGREAFVATADAAGIDAANTFTGESYDAMALIALAMQSSGSNDRAGINAKVLEVANAPGIEILPGELAKGLELLAAGEEIDYVGATGVELVGSGEAAGTYMEYSVVDGAYSTVGFH